MATPTFNATGVNGLTPLEFVNGGYAGALAATGNTVRVEVQELDIRTLEHATPGGEWVCQRTAGSGKRRVIWHVQLKATSEANLNTIEVIISHYLWDGRAYALTDGMGRSTSYATLRRDGTERVGPRLAQPGGARLQAWRLSFDILWPQPTMAYTEL